MPSVHGPLLYLTAEDGHHLIVGRFRFHFYSDEGGEPAHIHVATSDGECKFWLDPINLARNNGVRPSEIREIERLVFQHCEKLKEAYDVFHFGKNA